MRDIKEERYAKETRGRAFKVGLPEQTLLDLQHAVLRNVYKKRVFLKNPFDRVLYQDLLEQLRPATIIEVGSYQGGSALWFSDLCSTFDIDAKIICLDLIVPKGQFPDRIEFFQVDVLKAQETLPHERIQDLPHPWLVIEDSGHTYETITASLAYFAPKLQSGDYLVVEDGVVADLAIPEMRDFKDGPNRAVAEFLDAHPEFEIDVNLCDKFGHNVTYCPNGWLKKV